MGACMGIASDLDVDLNLIESDNDLLLKANKRMTFQICKVLLPFSYHIYIILSLIFLKEKITQINSSIHAFKRHLKKEIIGNIEIS